jgi:hypothetical protein
MAQRAPLRPGNVAIGVFGRCDVAQGTVGRCCNRLSRRSDAETSAIGEGIGQKIEAPAMVGSLRDR